MGRRRCALLPTRRYHKENVGQLWDIRKRAKRWVGMLRGVSESEIEVVSWGFFVGRRYVQAGLARFDVCGGQEWICD